MPHHQPHCGRISTGDSVLSPVVVTAYFFLAGNGSEDINMEWRSYTCRFSAKQTMRLYIANGKWRHCHRPEPPGQGERPYKSHSSQHIPSRAMFTCVCCGQGLVRLRRNADWLCCTVLAADTTEEPISQGPSISVTNEVSHVVLLSSSFMHPSVPYQHRGGVITR